MCGAEGKRWSFSVFGAKVQEAFDEQDLSGKETGTTVSDNDPKGAPEPSPSLSGTMFDMEDVGDEVR